MTNDDPRTIIDEAVIQVRAAVRARSTRHNMRLRQAAQLAVLALDRTVEDVTKTRIMAEKGRLTLVRRASCGRHGLARQIEGVRDVLHWNCFHANMFVGAERRIVVDAVLEAKELIGVLLRKSL